jgi:hypothetical protein
MRGTKIEKEAEDQNPVIPSTIDHRQNRLEFSLACILERGILIFINVFIYLLFDYAPFIAALGGSYYIT